MSTTTRSDLVQGTLDLLILKVLDLQANHGLGIARRIEQVTSGTFQVKPGSLFPALHRLEREGWLIGTWGESEHRRRAKYYELTRSARRARGRVVALDPRTWRHEPLRAAQRPARPVDGTGRIVGPISAARGHDFANRAVALVQQEHPTIRTLIEAQIRP